MSIRYFIEYALEGTDDAPVWKPIGVWAQGQGPGLDVAMAYLPGYEDLQEEADWVINRLVENDVKELAADFLDYHQQNGGYQVMREAANVTEDYTGAEACAAGELRRLTL